MQRDLYELGNTLTTQQNITKRALADAERRLKYQLRLHAHLQTFLADLNQLQREMECLGDSYCARSVDLPTSHHHNCPRSHAARLRYLILRAGETWPATEVSASPAPDE